MRITVIGSTGQTGGHVLHQGRERGHDIVAFTRRPEELADRGQLAGVFAGDGRDADALRPALTGSDAVIAIVGAGSRNGPHHAAEVAGALAGAMAQARVRRLVIVSAYPVVGRRPRVPLAIIRRVFGPVYADLRAMEAIVTGSALDWTIIRPVRLNDGPRTGQVTMTGGDLRRVPAVSRADLAQILLDRAEASTPAGEALNLAGA